MILADKKLWEVFMNKNAKKKLIIKQDLRIEKERKGKGDKYYVKWKGYDSSFINCIDKKYII